MRMVARICFQKADAELGVAALRERGYDVLTHVFEDEPDHVFAEAYRDGGSGTAMLRDVADIVDMFNGSVDEAGPVPAGHEPFKYDTPTWQ
jgi:hypothetical protein